MQSSCIPARVPRTCRYCGKAFLAQRCEVLKGKGLYCSRQCLYDRRAIALADRFWRHVRRTDDLFSCWEWTGVRRSSGYGQIHVRENGRPGMPHRVSWELHFGPIPEGLCVLHHCDNPPCVRPDHLFLGTKGDNAADMAAKSRQPQGEKHGMTSLAAEQVRELRRRYAEESVTMKALAAEYGVCTSTVCNIIHRKTWRHLD